jgi:hypothetical protein
LDEAQYRANHGPCLEAVQNDRQICTEDYSAWSSFRRKATASGVRAVLSTPVLVSDSVHACLNLYSFSTFSREAAAAGSVLAEHIGPVIGNILDYEKANSLNIGSGA